MHALGYLPLVAHLGSKPIPQAFQPIFNETYSPSKSAESVSPAKAPTITNSGLLPAFEIESISAPLPSHKHHFSPLKGPTKRRHRSLGYDGPFESSEFVPTLLVSKFRKVDNQSTTTRTPVKVKNEVICLDSSPPSIPPSNKKENVTPGGLIKDIKKEIISIDSSPSPRLRKQDKNAVKFEPTAVSTAFINLCTPERPAPKREPIPIISLLTPSPKRDVKPMQPVAPTRSVEQPQA